MNGTEKQIAWAEDIKADFMRVCNEIVTYYEDKIQAEKEAAMRTIAKGRKAYTYESDIHWHDEVKAMIDCFAEEQNATFWIDNRNRYEKTDKAHKDIQRVSLFHCYYEDSVKH